MGERPSQEELKGCMEKSFKWHLILLPNCLVFAWETKAEFDIITSITYLGPYSVHPFNWPQIVSYISLCLVAEN